MKATTLIVALACTPAALVAQRASATTTASASASASQFAWTSSSVSGSASANARTNVSVPASYSAESRAKINAAFRAARARRVPEQPMEQRMAEGQAKGGSETQVVAAVQKVEARLEASQTAMIRAGRAHPQPQEIAAGEQAMERGASEAEIEGLATHTPSNRSLTVALNVLAQLEANGRPVGNALAEVQSKLDARVSDDAISALVGGNAAADGHGSANGVAGAGGAAGAAGLGAGVSGAVHGVLGGKKP